MEQHQIERYFKAKEVNRSGLIRYIPNIIFLDNDEDTYNKLFYSKYVKIYNIDNIIIYPSI